MAFGTNSKVFSAFITDALNHTNAFDLNSDALKVAIYNNTGTPDQTDTAAHNAYNGSGGAWVVANEASNGGWSAGGLALASVTSGFASNVYTFDAADTANGSAATIADTRGCLLYDSTLTTPVANQGISFHSFGGLTAVTAGTLTIVWNASGIIQLTL
jgi:hypothetical protein